MDALDPIELDVAGGARPAARRPVRESLNLQVAELHLRAVTTIPQKELRNQVSEVLRRVEAGETLTVTVAGREVAELSPVRRHRWVRGSALDRVWRGPAPRDLERDIAMIDTSVIDPYDT